MNFVFPFTCLSQAVLSFPAVFTGVNDTKTLVPICKCCYLRVDPFSGEGMTVWKYTSFAWKSVSGQKSFIGLSSLGLTLSPGLFWCIMSCVMGPFLCLDSRGKLFHQCSAREQKWSLRRQEVSSSTQQPSHSVGLCKALLQFLSPFPPLPCLVGLSWGFTIREASSLFCTERKTLHYVYMREP